MKFVMIGDSWGRMFGYNEWIPTLFPKISDYALLRDIAMEIYEAVGVLVQEQLKTYDPEHERHFLDQYHKRMLENADDPKNTFYRMSALQYSIYSYDFLCFCFWFHFFWLHYSTKNNQISN